MQKEKVRAMQLTDGEDGAQPLPPLSSDTFLKHFLKFRKFISNFYPLGSH